VLQQPSRANPIHNLTLYFFNIEFNIILPCTPTFFPSGLFPPIFFSPQKPCRNFSACALHAPPISSLLTYSNNIWWGAQTVRLLIVQRPVPLYFLHPTVNPCPLFSKVLFRCFSRNVKDWISQRCADPGCQDVLAIELGKRAPKIRGSTSRNLLHVTLLSPRILRWLLDLEKFVHPSFTPI